MKNTNISTSHLDYIKRRNLNNIVKLIRVKGAVSRAQVAAEMGLSKSAVSTLVDELLEKGIVQETGIGSSTAQGGRRSILLSFDPDYRLCIGVNITSKFTSILIANLDGNVRYYDKYAKADHIPEIVGYIRDSINKHCLSLSSIAGIGLAVPGITDVASGIVVESPSMGWVNLDLASHLSCEFPFPVFVLNDVDCLALGENWIGSAASQDNIYFIGINDGLGSSLIINGQLYTGSNGQAGEVGYTILDSVRGDWKCNQFGQYGWLEQTVSGWALQKTGLSVEKVFEAYAMGSSAVAATVDLFIRNLSVMIANCVALLNPDCVVIGGEASEYMGNVVPIIRDNVSQMVPIRVEVRTAQLGEKAYNFGAIAHALSIVDLID